MRAAVLLGLLDGLLIALLAAGVVLIYKAERFVNFANAQLGVLSSLLLAKLVLDAGMNWYLALVVAVALGVMVGAGCRHFVIARLEHASRTSLIIATLGLSQLLLALTYFTWLGPDRSKLRLNGYPLPFEFLRQFDELAITTRHVLIAVLVPSLVVGLAVFLRGSSFGRAMRAASSNPDAARLTGVNIRRTSTAAWAIAGGLSAVGAVLASPGQAVLEVQSTGPTLLLQALGAAALAGFTSLPVALAAGVGLGVVEGLGVHYGHSTGAGVAALFTAVLVGLLVRSFLVGRTESEDLQIEHSEEAFRIPEVIAGRWFVRHRVAAAAGVSLAIACVLPYLPWLSVPHRTFVLANVAVLALAGLSLTMLSGWAGQVSLGQFAFVAIGAFTAARVAPNGWSLLATMFVSAVVGAAFAVVAGLPALRSRGLTLAVTTLGLAVVGPVWLFRQTWLAPAGTSSVPPAYQAGIGELLTQRSVYFAALAALVLVTFALTRLRRSNAGRTILAVRDNAVTAAALGFSPTAVRLTTFALSGALASAAGVLWLAVNRNISVQVVGPSLSLLLLSITVIGGLSSVAGPALGSIVIFGIPGLLADPLHSVIANTAQLQLFLSGAGLLVTQIAHPAGIAGSMRRGLARLLRRMAAEEIATNEVAGPRAHFALSVRDVCVSFGGVTVVDGVDLDVEPGEVVGLIGANGAGKSTLLNAVSGFVPARGSIMIFGREVSALAPELRAHVGLTRGFQDSRLFPALTVRETIELALGRHYPTGRLGALVGAPWVRFAERRLAVEAQEFIDRFGLSGYADLPSDQLSTGTRHICDLAVQAATRPRLIVLDEPTSGVAQRETEAFRPLIRRFADELGCAVLVVEHDVPLLMAVADRIYCLERGRVIAEGTAEQVRENPEVVASYLGAAVRRGAKPNRPHRRASPSRAHRRRDNIEEKE